MIDKSDYIKKQVHNWNIMAGDQEKRTSTHPDEYLARLELEFLLSHIKGNVLNIGCGSGSETYECSKVTGLCATGVDLSDRMIDIAQRNYPTLNFKVSNILDLPFTDKSFDSITTRRTLINLLDRGDQMKAIDEMKRVLKPNGNLVIIEATDEGYNSLNSLRSMVGLPPINVVDYNLPIREKDIFDNMHGLEVIYLNTYYYLTRIFYPLMEKNIEYNTSYHKNAYLLQKEMDISIHCSPHILINWKKL